MRHTALFRVWRVIPLVALVATGGCFATRSDVRIVQSDVASLRTELLRNDAAQKESLTQALKILAAVSDSLTRVSVRTVGIQGDVRGEMRSIKEQLLQVQTLLGQSQATITRLRAELEARNNAMPVTPPSSVPPASGAPATSAAPPSVPVTTSGAGAAGAPPAADSTVRGPGPTQLYQNGLDQLKRGSSSTARILFQELLSTYPTSDLAPDAQFYIAESLSREKNLPGADAAYAAVVAKYGDSPRAPTAVYKRAQIALQQGNSTDARKLLNEVISRYPRSTEADLATEQLKQIR